MSDKLTELRKLLPTLKGIIADPNHALVPSEPEGQYMLASMLEKSVKDGWNSYQDIKTYVDRLDQTIVGLFEFPAI